MALAEGTRTFNGTAIATPGTWDIDPSHSSIEFVVRHLMVAKVRGGFTEFSGSITVAENPEESTAEATITAASITTRDAQRDEHLRSPDFLDVANHETLGFVGSEVKAIRGSRWRLGGDLTIRGTTRAVELEVEFQGVTKDPWGNQRAVFSAATTINREDYGLTWNQALETGGVLVGKDIRIELEIEAVRR